MRNSSQKRYDKKSRMCRILLADYLAIKALSQRAGITMAEALHKLITMRIKPEPATERITETAYRAEPTQAYRAEPTQAYRVLPIKAIATNGSKAAAFRIKTKGVRRE